MPDCIFCRIVSKDLSAEIIYEDSDSLAFLDINPIAPGHTIIIPKQHAAALADLEDDKVTAIFSAAKIIMRQIEKALSPGGFNYGVNQGRIAGQAIDHLHLHVLPRFENDGGGSMHSIVRNPPKKQTLEEIAGSIRAAADTTPIPKKEIAKPVVKEEPKKEATPEESVDEKLKKLEAELAFHVKKFKGMKRP